MTECFICFDETPPLISPCACSSAAHPKCLARWQMHRRGTSDEKQCRLCKQPLPAWQSQMRDEPLPPLTSSQQLAVFNRRFRLALTWLSGVYFSASGLCIAHEQRCGLYVAKYWAVGAFMYVGLCAFVGARYYRLAMISRDEANQAPAQLVGLV